MVDGGTQLAIRARCLDLPVLRGHRPKVAAAHGGLFLGCWPGNHAPSAAVEADAADGAKFIVHAFVVDVVDHGDVHIGYVAVVEEMIVIPMATEVTVAKVAKAVVNSAIEADDWSPIAGVEEVAIRAPSPVAGSPEEAYLGRIYPCAGNPVVIADGGIPGPIPGCPKVIRPGANGLGIHRQGRGSEVDEKSDGDVGRSGLGRQQKRCPDHQNRS